MVPELAAPGRVFKAALVVCDRGESGADCGVSKADEKRLLALEKPLMIRTRAAAPNATPPNATADWSRFCAALSCAALLPLLVIAPALGQTAAPAAPAVASAPAPVPTVPLPTVPNDIKSKNDMTADRPQIQKFIELATVQLASGTPEQQSKARDALRSEALLTGQPNASAAYLDAYAQALNTQLLPLAQSSNVHARLNAAIVTYSVALVANNAQLAPSALAFISIKDEKAGPEVLWGIKAARWIIPAQIGAFAGQKNLALFDAIIAAVAAHPNGQIGGAIAYEAYEAVTLDIATPTRPKATPAMQIIAAPYVQKLLETRLQMYINGVPPSPRSEPFGSSFLSGKAVWTTLPPATQLKIMQDFCDLVGLMGQQAAQANPGDKTDLALAISSIASAISVLADPPGNGPVTLAIAPATKLNARTAPGDITAAVSAILPAVQLVPQFKGLAATPKIVGHAAAPAPASAPTTNQVVIPGAMPVPVAVPAAPAATRPRPAPTPSATPGAGNTGRPSTPPPKPAYK